MASTLISDLDEALVENGQDVTLRRVFGTGASAETVDVTVRANVRHLNQPEELIGGLTQDDLKLIMSTTQIFAADWPGQGSEGTGVHHIDRRIPRKNDKLIVNGRIYRVEYVNQIKIGDQVVRLEVVTKGGAAG